MTAASSVETLGRQLDLVGGEPPLDTKRRKEIDVHHVDLCGPDAKLDDDVARRPPGCLNLQEKGEVTSKRFRFDSGVSKSGGLVDSVAAAYNGEESVSVHALPCGQSESPEVMDLSDSSESPEVLDVPEKVKQTEKPELEGQTSLDMTSEPRGSPS